MEEDKGMNRNRGVNGSDRRAGGVRAARVVEVLTRSQGS